MRRRLHKLTSFVIALFMTLEVMVPSFYSLAEEEKKTDQDPYKIEISNDKYGKDNASEFSLKLATMVDDKNLDSKEKLKFALSTVEDTQNFKLIVRKDFKLYDEYSYDVLEDAEKEFNRVKESYEKQGLDLDISLVEEDGRYFIHNNEDDRAEENNFGKDYTTYYFNVRNDFDFDKKGLQNKIPEANRPERLFIFNFEIKESIDKSFTMISLKDDEENQDDPDDPDPDPIKVVNEGDIIGDILDDEYYTTYGTDLILNDMDEALNYKEEEKAKKEAEAEKKKQEEQEAEEKKQAEEDKKLEEEKSQAEKENKEEEKKESKTEIITEEENEEKPSEKTPDINEENKDTKKEEESEDTSSKTSETKNEESKESNKNETSNLKNETSSDSKESLNISSTNKEDKFENKTEAKKENSTSENKVEDTSSSDTINLNKDTKDLLTDRRDLLSNLDKSLNAEKSRSNNKVSLVSPKLDTENILVDLSTDKEKSNLKDNPKSKRFSLHTQIIISANETDPLEKDYYFDLVLDKHLNAKGIKVNNLYNDKKELLAKGVYDETANSIRYTFETKLDFTSQINIDQELGFSIDDNTSFPLTIDGLGIRDYGKEGIEKIYPISIEEDEKVNTIDVNAIALESTIDNSDFESLMDLRKNMLGVNDENDLGELELGGPLVAAPLIAMENQEPDFEINDLEFTQVGASGITSNLKVTKTDDFGKPLSGASFKLSKQGSDLFYTFTSDETGTHTIEGISPGTYIFEETAAPEGYEKSHVTYTVYVDDAGNIWSVENKPTTANTLSLDSFNSTRMNILDISPDFSFTPLRATGGSVVTVNKYELVPAKGSTGTSPTIHFNSNEAIKLNLDISVADSAEKGDTFTIQLDKNLVPSQIMPLSPENSPGYTWTPPSLSDGSGYTIATGVYNPYTNAIIYTFTDYVDKKDNVRASLSLGNIGTNKQNIKTNGVYSFTNYVDGKAQPTVRFNVDYGKPSAHQILKELDGKNAITEINPQEKKIRYVAYINPDGQGPKTYPTELIIQDNESYPNTSLIMSNANIRLYRVPSSLVINQDYMPDSMMPDMKKLEKYIVNTRVNDVYNKNAKQMYLDYNTTSFAYVVIADIPYKDNADRINMGFVWKSTNPTRGGGINHNAYIGIRGSSGEGSGDEIIPLPKEASLTVVNKPSQQPQNTGSFTIDKTDNNNKPLDGAVFELESRDGQNYKVTLDQSANGKFEVNNIPPGSYILREIKAPENYKKTDKEWNVFVNSKGQVTIEDLGSFTPTPGVGGQDVTNKVKLNKENSGISGNDTIRMGSTDNNIHVVLDMNIDEKVNPGDYIKINISDSLHYNILQPDKLTYAAPVDGNQKIADVVLGENFDIESGTGKDIYLVFTDYVADKDNVHLVVDWGHSVNVNICKNNGKYIFGATVGETTVQKESEILYKNPQVMDQISVSAGFSYTNDKTGNYTQLAYINPNKGSLNGESIITVYPEYRYDNRADIGPEKTNLTLYKLKAGEKITNAVIFEPNKWEEVTADKYSVNFVNKIKLYNNNVASDLDVRAVEIHIDGIGTETYLLKVDSEMKGSTSSGEKTLLGQWIQVANNGSGAGRASGIEVNTSGGTGTGESDYTRPILQVINEPADKGRFEINKVGKDGEKEAPLAGAEFTLSKSGNVIFKRISDDNGKVIFDNLEPGTYTLVESNPPEGYKGSDKKWTVEVDKNGVTTVHEETTETASSGFENAFNSLGLSDNPIFQNLRALPEGTTKGDVSIKPSKGTAGNATVNTNARYLDNNEFEVKLDITAGEDKVVQGPDTDVVILIQEPMLTTNVKNALINKINEYGDNVKVAVHIYGDRTGINSTLTFGTKSEAITKIRNSSLGYSYPNTAVRVQYALDTANRVFAKGSAPQKELISIVGNSVDKTAGITNQVNKLNNKNVNISSIYVGGAGSANLYMQRWSDVLGVPTVNASESNYDVLNNTLKVYGTAVQKAVENAIFQVSFNNNFEFAGGSTQTSKSNPSSGQWHSSYNKGTKTIDLRSGELTLNANQTATMTFRVKAVGDLKAGETYPLINDIIFKPNSTSGEQSIKAPQAKVAEGTFNLNIKSTHTGTVPNGAYGQFELFRTGSDGKSEKVGFYKFNLGQSIEIPSLRLKDSSGQNYNYTVENIWFSDPDIHSLGTTQGMEQNTITIRSEYRPGFKIDVDWGPLQPTGTLTIGLSNGETIELKEGNYNYYNPDITENYPVVVSVAGEEGYIHSIRQNSESSWSIVVRKKDSPSIKVVNEKQSTKLTILKVDENDTTKVLPGATFTLNGTDLDNKYSKTLVSDDEGKLTFTGLTPGTYTLKETQAPEGYENQGLEWTVIVSDDNKVSIIKNSSDITEDYNSSDGNPRTVTVSGSPAVKLQQTITKEDGKFILNVSIERYLSNNYYYPFNLTFDTENFEIVNLNNSGEYSNGIFSKTIYTSKNYGNEVLKFEIKPKDLNNFNKLNPTSKMSFSTLELPGDYLASIQKNTNVLKDDGDNTFEYEISNPLKKYDVEFTKVEKIEEDGKISFNPLQGAEFELEKKEGEDSYTKLDGKYTSGEDGKLLIKELEAGEYRLSEVTPPKGYRPIKGFAKEFKIEKDGNILIKDGEGNFVEKTEELQRIENKKFGEYEYSFIKKDAGSGEPINGVVFEIRDSDGVVMGDQRTSGTSSRPGIDPDVDGKVTFTELTPGKYWIYEVNQKEGYIKSPKPLQVVVGEEYEVPENPKNPQDVSKYFTLDSSKTSTMTSTKDNERVVYPNETEGLFAKMYFNIDDSIQVKPGDTFILQLSNNVDLDGIGKETSDSFDIYSALGRIAKAEILPGRKSIKYTFTTALDEVDKITNLTINTPMFIDRYQVPGNSSQTVNVSIGSAKFTDSIYVSYDAPNNYGYINNNGNVKTYQLKLDPNTGEFTSVIYINPWHKDDGWKELFFSANTNITINSIKAYKTTDGTTTLPWSYGINFDDYTYVYKYNLSNIYYNSNMSYNLNKGYAYKLQLGSEYNTDEYVVEIKGKVTGKTNSFVTYSNYLRRNRTSYWNGWQWVNNYSGTIEDAWETWVAYYSPDTESDTERILYNQKNKIEYTKMSGKLVANTPPAEGGDGSGDNVPAQGTKPVYSQVPDQALKGAEFQLLKKNGDNWENYGDVKTSGEDGKFFWEGLPQGEYQVKETKAPDGYQLPDEAVSSFEVNENGEIVNIKNNTTIIINEKDEMYFKLQKIWQDTGENGNTVDNLINSGTLELKLQAPTGQTFAEGLTAEESIPEGKYYRIKEVSKNKDYIIIEIDLKAASEAGVHENGIQIDVPSDWPSGDYTLTEIKAPAGYKKTDEKYKIIINQTDKTIKYGDKNLYSKTESAEKLEILKIVNERGLFPSTGGIGTLLFSLLGVLVMIMGVYVYRRKKVVE